MRKMKDSGVEWIGEIPEDWKIKRIKAVLNERNEPNNPVKTDFILSLTNDRGVIPYTEKGDVGNKSKDDLTGYKLAYKNDIILNSMNVIIGSVELSAYFGCVSPVYYMLYPRNIEDCVRYYNYLFQTKELQNKLKGYGNGIMEIRMRIQMSKLNTVEFPIAPPEQQHRIAIYLDDKCAKIDAIIAREQAVIEKLKAYKLSVITEAVTKGLNPDVPMKDSGIEWIGEIPAEWECIRAKYVIKIENGSDPITDGDIPVYGSGSGSFKTCGEYKVGPTVLIGRKGATLNIPHYITERYWNIDTAFNVTVKTSNFSLLYYFYNAICFDYNFYISATTLPSMTQTNYGNMVLPYPEIQEQQTISDYLDSKCEKIDHAISRKQAVINKLTEYKKSLIYEVVTGKKEV